MKYINLENTSGNAPADGLSWIDYYWSSLSFLTQLQMQQWNVICPRCGKPYTKTNIAVGAHVGKISFRDRKAYIIPMCSACNQLTGSFSLPNPVVKVEVPSDSPHYSDITYPASAVHTIKREAGGALEGWNGHVV